MVAYWMTEVGKYVGSLGINNLMYRSCNKSTDISLYDNIQDTYIKELFINKWTLKGYYSFTDKYHSIIKANYIHITSPLRRIIDAYNIYIL